jgi:hypothetical protein
MRFIITCRIPVEKGNKLAKKGALGPPSLALIHRSAWKVLSVNFGFTAFYEVRA